MRAISTACAWCGIMPGHELRRRPRCKVRARDRAGLRVGPLLHRRHQRCRECQGEGSCDQVSVLKHGRVFRGTNCISRRSEPGSDLVSCTIVLSERHRGLHLLNPPDPGRSAVSATPHAAHRGLPRNFNSDAEVRILRSPNAMSRPLRLHVPDVLIHVFSRGNNKSTIFVDDHDVPDVISTAVHDPRPLQRRVPDVLPSQQPLSPAPPPHEQPVSRMMQQLNSTYCQRFNRRHGRVGHVLQGRFGSRLVQDGGYARTVLRYLALNPVIAGLAPTPGPVPLERLPRATRVGCHAGVPLAAPRVVRLRHVRSRCWTRAVRRIRPLGGLRPLPRSSPAWGSSTRRASRA